MHAHIAGAAEQAKQLDLIEHQGLKGRLREIVVSQIITPFLPPTCAAVHGTAIDMYGVIGTSREKTEDDILIVDRELIAPAMFSADEGIVPYDSVLYRVEVKSKLSSENLRDAIRGATEFRKLKLTPAVNNAEPPLAPQLIFAFESDMKGPEFDRFKQVDGTKPNESGYSPISAVCVIGKELFFHGNTGDDNGDQWRSVSAGLGKPYEYGVDAVSIMLNNIVTLRESRRRAKLADYTVDIDACTKLDC